MGPRRAGSGRDTPHGSPQATRLDWPRTLSARGADRLQATHLRHRAQQRPAGALHCFVLDCSASMLAQGRLAHAKGVLLDLMQQAYRQRDDVALLCFAAGRAELRLPPRRASFWRDDWIAPIAGGGGTSLALGVQQAGLLLARQARCQPQRTQWLWLLTDGRSPERPARPAAADQVRVIDFEQARVAIGRAAQLASSWQAGFCHADAWMPL